MDVKETFTKFCNEVFSGQTIEVNIDKNVDEFESFYPSIVQIIQKDVTFFKEDRVVFGRNLSDVDESTHDAIWRNLVPCLLTSFFHGDIKKKVSKISGIVKNIWNASGQANDDITNVLNDEASEGRFQDIIDYVLNCRLAKIFTNLVESFDISEFELNINDPAELIEMLKNPEHEQLQKISQKVQNIMKDKIKRGEFTQQTIINEVEAIKAKVIGLFGNVFNEALGGRRGETPIGVLTGNSPEARRQRMLARMQRKLREKNSK
jgi:hypothetical protein